MSPQLAARCGEIFGTDGRHGRSPLAAGNGPESDLAAQALLTTLSRRSIRWSTSGKRLMSR